MPPASSVTRQADTNHSDIFFTFDPRRQLRINQSWALGEIDPLETERRIAASYCILPILPRGASSYTVEEQLSGDCTRRGLKVNRERLSFHPDRNELRRERHSCCSNFVSGYPRFCRNSRRCWRANCAQVGEVTDTRSQ